MVDAAGNVACGEARHLRGVRVLGGGIGGVQEQQINAQALQSRCVCQGGLPAHVPGVQDVLHTQSRLSRPAAEIVIQADVGRVT